MNRIFVSLLGGLTVYFALSGFSACRRNARSSRRGIKSFQFRTQKQVSLPRLLMRIVLFGVLCLILGLPPQITLMVIAVPAAAHVLQQRAERRRYAKMEEQLPDALALMGNAITAGFSLIQALAMVGREVADPLGGVFRRVVSRINLGVSVDVAVQDAAREIGSEDFDTVAAAISIQRTTGGNLPRILEIVANAVRRKQQLSGKIRSLTAQGKLTAAIISFLPIILLIVMKGLMPSYVAPLFDEPRGRVLLVLAGIMEIVGLWMIHRIASLDY